LKPTEILEEHHYYPFGLEHQNYSTITGNTGYKYTFGGKEFQPEKGMNMYDFGARNYDPTLGRWMNVDPLVEKTMEAYSYVGNNPIRFTDPTGMIKDDIIINNKDKKEIIRIIVDTGDKDYVFDTELNINPDKPLVFDTGMSMEDLKKQYDAIGINLSGSATVGGGMEFGLSITYFLNGESEGNLGIYTSKGGNVGVGGGAGFSFFGSEYNKKALQSNFNAKGFEGAYNSISIGAFGIDYSTTWSNEKNTHDEIYPGHRYPTTWASKSLGYSSAPKTLSQVLGKAGKASATYSGGTSTLSREFKSKKVKK